MKSLVRLIRRSPVAGMAADTVRWVRDPAMMRRQMADAHATFSEAAFTRTLPQAGQGARSVLILSMIDNSYSVKLECMLALELKRRGWHVRVLTSNLYSNAKRIFAAYGIDDLVSYERVVLNSKLHRQVMAETSRRASEPMDFDSVRQWTYRGCWIGPQLLATVSRQTFSGAPDPKDPKIRSELLTQLPITLGCVHAAIDYLDTQPPDLVLVNEPNSSLGPFVDQAIGRGIPVIQFVQPSREDTLVFKRLTPETRRIHPNSVSIDVLAELVRQPWTVAHERTLDEEFRRRYGGVWRIQGRNQPGTVDMTAQEVNANLRLDPDKPTAVLFSHVLWDANLFYGKDLFDNYGHWFVETVKAAAANSRLNWLVKLHPANLWKREMSGVTAEYDEVRLIRGMVGELPDHVHLVPPDTKVSTLSLFRMAHAGITVRGSIGYEMPCFGAPVVTAGTGRYSGFGFTQDHASATDYLATLSRLETLPRLSADQVRHAKIHAYALLVRRPWTFSSFRAQIGADVTDPLNQNLHLTARTFKEVAHNGDLAAFADWATVDSGVDYLAPDPLAMDRRAFAAS